MTLRGNAGRLVQGVNNLSGFVKLTEGPGIQIVQSNAKNSLQFSTDTATLDLDDILANGDSTARSAKFLNNASDTIPALIVHNTLDFGSGAAVPGVTLKYSPGTPDGLVIGPTTGIDKKILRSDIIGANTSSAIAVKSGMTFDTGLTLTVDNLVAKSVTNNGDVVAHRLLPYDAAGVTINLDTCTMTCADTVTDPRVNIYPGLNCYGYITGSAGLALTGDFIINGMITTPTLLVPIDLTLKPSGDVRIFSGKILFCDTISQNSTSNNLAITAVGTNKNINLTASGTGTINLNSPAVGSTITATTFTAPTGSNLNINATGGSILSTALNWSATGALGINSGGTMTLWPKNGQCIIDANLTVNRSITGSRFVGTEFVSNVLNAGIALSPNGTGQVNVLAGKTLTADTISSTTANGNLTLSPNGTGEVNISSALRVNTIGSYNNNHLTLSALPNASSGNILLQATGTGQVISNKAFITSVIGSPSGFDITMVPNTGKLYVNGTLVTSNGISTEVANGNLALAANGTGTINLNSAVIGSSITANTFTSPALTNLTINSPGGSIITNAVRIAPTTSLTIAPATSLTFIPGSPAQFNCSVNVSNDLSVTGSINGNGLTNTTTNGNLFLSPNGTGQVQIATGKTLTADSIVSRTISNNGDITAINLKPYDGAGLSINLNTCTLTCADSIANPQIIINPQLQVNGTLSCTAGMSLSGGDLMVWSKITTPYVGSATDLQLYPTGNVRVMGNKTLFCNAISQNDTNADLYLTAGGTNQNVVLSPAGTGQVQVLTGKCSNAAMRVYIPQKDSTMTHPQPAAGSTCLPLSCACAL